MLNLRQFEPMPPSPYGNFMGMKPQKSASTLPQVIPGLKLAD
jgi:hypothetical protein